MSTSFDQFEFYEGGRTDSRAPRITVRRSGQLALTGAAVALLGEGVSHVQVGFDAVTQAVGIRPAAEGARGVSGGGNPRDSGEERGTSPSGVVT